MIEQLINGVVTDVFGHNALHLSLHFIIVKIVGYLQQPLYFNRHIFVVLFNGFGYYYLLIVGWYYFFFFFQKFLKQLFARSLAGKHNFNILTGLKAF